MTVHIHPTAEVSDKAIIGERTRIWHQVQVREGARIGQECIIGKGAYIDFDVIIGSRCKLQNGVYVYHGATLEDGVFLGPGVMLLNDKNPRAVNPDGSLKSDADWAISPTFVGQGAGIGGGAIVLPGVSIGNWAIVGSGAVVTKDVPAYGLVYGNPARLTGFVSPHGQRMVVLQKRADVVNMSCPKTGVEIDIPTSIYEKLG